MLIRPFPSLRRIHLLLLGAAFLAVPSGLRADDALPGVSDAAPGVSDAAPPVVQDDEGVVEKRGRITPFNGAALPEGEIPAFQSPEAAKKADDEAKKARCQEAGAFDRR